MSKEGTEEAALAFLLHLDPAVQHTVYERFGEALAVPRNEEFAHRRASRVARALHEAKRILGKSPSIREYAALRRGHPEWEWPNERSVMRWLGVRGWNNALVRMGLEALVDGDAIERPGPRAYRPEELIQALRECARDLGHVPSYNDYFSWTRHPDVEDRSGRRPRSQVPFERVFGGFQAARVAAGLVEPDSCAAPTMHEVIRLPKWGTDPKELLDHIRLVAHRVQGPMTAARYERERRAVFAETSAERRPLALASSGTIYRHFRFWSAALEAAGVFDEGEASGDLPGPTRPRVRKYNEEQLLSAVSEAHDALDEPFSCEAYKRWRDARCATQPQRRWILPHAVTVRKHFGSWTVVVERMYEWRGAARR